MSRVGKRLGPYRLDKQLGAGGMGVVWQATNIDTGQIVAIKELRADTWAGAGSPDAVRRFMREARAAMAVDHPNVVKVHEIKADGDAPYMVMDLLRGESLAARLDRESKLSLGECARILSMVVSAVGTAHERGIVHRDLKPDNIFLTESDDVRVLDFGIAKFMADAQQQPASHTTGLTATGSLLGTPHYMSPEQVFGEKDIDHRTDVWSLGVILFECLTGRRPVEGPNVGQILKAISSGKISSIAESEKTLPPELTSLIDRMLARSPGDRPGDLRVVHEELSRHSTAASAPASFGAASTIEWRPDDADLYRTPEPTTTTTRRPVALIASLGALLVGATAFFFVTRRSAEPPTPAVTYTPSAAPTPSASIVVPEPSEPPIAASTSAVPSAAPTPKLAAKSATPPMKTSASAPTTSAKVIKGGVVGDVPF